MEIIKNEIKGDENDNECFKLFHSKEKLNKILFSMKQINIIIFTKLQYRRVKRGFLFIGRKKDSININEIYNEFTMKLEYQRFYF